MGHAVLASVIVSCENARWAQGHVVLPAPRKAQLPPPSRAASEAPQRVPASWLCMLPPPGPTQPSSAASVKSRIRQSGGGEGIRTWATAGLRGMRGKVIGTQVAARWDLELL